MPTATAALLGLVSGAALHISDFARLLALVALAGGVLVAASSSVSGVERPARWLSILLLAAALLAGLALAPASIAPSKLPPAGVARMHVVVEETRFAESDRARSRVRVIDGFRLADRAVIARGTSLWVEPWPLPEGATLRMLATLSPQARFRNASPHPSLPSTHPTQGRAEITGVDAYEVVAHPLLPRMLNALRVHVRERLDETLHEETSAVARSLILGDPDSLAEEDQKSVRISGMAHVFAVSGMHVTLLAGSVMLGLTWLLLRIPKLATRFETRRIAAGAAAPLALFIAAFTGGAPSGYRAAVTTAIAWTLVACGRKPSTGAVTAATCLLFAALEPRDALRPSFLLSIAATAAIVAGARERASTLHDLVASACSLSFRTSLATAPIVLWSFGTLPVVGVAANLVLVPLGSALLVLAALHALLAVIVTPLSVITAIPLSTASRAFLSACQAFAEMSPEITWPVLNVWQGLCVALATSVLLFVARARTRVIACCALAACMVLAEWQLRVSEKPRGELRATFLDVGQGDAALIDFPDGRCMLIDAGGNPQGGADPGERVLVPLLRARRRDHIDIAVLSHPHPDHFGGLRAVFASTKVSELWDTGQAEGEAHLETTSGAARDLVARARASGTRVMRPAELCAAPRVFGGAVVEVLWPCPRYDSDHDPNDNSLVLRITYKQRSLLFTGDVEAHAESTLVAQRAALRADVFKVPHHGSRTSSSEAFVRAAAPKLALMSAGAVNRFGHPHVDVVQRLKALVPNVIDIGTHGGVMVRTDGRELTWHTWSGAFGALAASSARQAVHDSERRCVPDHMRPETAKLAPSGETSASTENGVAHSK